MLGGAEQLVPTGGASAAVEFVMPRVQSAPEQPKKH
jgi:hypothetical protein